MKGRMPNSGSLAVEAHLVPKRKSLRPISRMAGRPEMMRYTVMNSTKATATSPHRKKRTFIPRSSSSRSPFFITRGLFAWAACGVLVVIGVSPFSRSVEDCQVKGRSSGEINETGENGAGPRPGLKAGAGASPSEGGLRFNSRRAPRRRRRRARRWRCPWRSRRTRGRPR